MQGNDLDTPTVDALYLNVIKMYHLSQSIECHDYKAEILPGVSGKALLSPSHSKELTAYHAILNGSEIAMQGSLLQTF